MLTRSPRAALLWAGALATAVVTAVVVGGDLARLHRAAGRAGVSRSVVVATADLRPGHVVGRGDLARRRVPEPAVPDGVISADAAAGRVVVVTVLDGGVLTRRHLAPRDRTGLDGVVPAGHRAVRIAATGPPVRPGDRVDVLAPLEAGLPGASGEAAAPAARAALLVAEPGTAADGRLIVTLVVTADEAPLAIAAGAAGTAALALRPPDDQ